MSWAIIAVKLDWIEGKLATVEKVSLLQKATDLCRPEGSRIVVGLG